MKRLLTIAVLLLGVTRAAHAADTTYTWVDSSSTTHTVATFGCNTSQACPLMVPADPNGVTLTAAPGAAIPSSALFIGGSDGTDLRALLTDSSGRLTVIGQGVAGTPAGGVFTIQGVTSMTPVQVSQATASNLNATVTGSGSAGSAAAGVLSVQGIASMTPVLVTMSGTNDPCQTATKTNVAFSQTSNTKLFSKTSSKKNYICSLLIVGSDAENWSIVEGTKTTNDCDTSTAAIIGGTTAAAGPHFAANGGASFGNGGWAVAFGANNNFDVCLYQSGSGTIAGVLTYVQN